MKLLLSVLTLSLSIPALAVEEPAGGPREKVYSGPQVGEKLLPFKVVRVYGKREGEVEDFTSSAGKKPVLLIFVNGANRPAARVVRAVINYAEMRSEELFAGLVWLAGDLSGAKGYLHQAVSWWGVNAPVGISVDGAEGPGSHGFNRQVNLTVLLAREGRVVANYALVQPSPQDVPRILRDVTELIGGKVPSLEEIEFLTRPTRSTENVRWRKAPTDVKLRKLICEAIATGDDRDLLNRKAAEIKRYVREGDQAGKLQRQLGEVAAMLGELRVGGKNFRKLLEEWKTRYDPASAGKSGTGGRSMKKGG